MTSHLSLGPWKQKNIPLKLVFLLAFCVAAMGTYFNMLPLPRLETKQNSCVDLVHFTISMALNPGIVNLKMGMRPLKRQAPQR